MRRQLVSLGILCILALASFFLHSWSSPHSTQKAPPKDGRQLQSVSVEQVSSSFSPDLGTGVYTTVVPSELPPACVEAILEFGRAYRDLVRIDPRQTVTRRAFQELLATKVVRDFASESPCAEVPSSWMYISTEFQNWKLCYDPPPEEEPSSAFESNFCESMLTELLVAATYLENRTNNVGEITDPNVIKQLLKVESRLHTDPFRAEKLVDRWLALDPTNLEAKFERAAVMHAQALSDPSPERIARFESALNSSLKTPSPDAVYDLQTARLELSVLKGDWKEVVEFTRQMPVEDERRTYYRALALHRNGRTEEAIQTLKNGHDSESQRILIASLLLRKPDSFEFRPIVVSRPYISYDGVRTSHTWVKAPMPDLETMHTAFPPIPEY